MADVSQIKLPNGSVYDLIDEKSGYITAEYIENKTDYEIPVSRVGEIVVGETAIGTNSTNFPTSKAVVDYVDERVVQEIEAIDIPTVPTKTSDLTNDSGYLTTSDIASVMTYKGTKANYAALPSTGNTTGDVWHLTDTGAEWAWDGSAWQELGTAIDMSNYLTTSDIAAWAKASTKPTYTAAEVGALPDSTTIPSKVSDLTNDSGFISSYTETDPVFSASAAAGITSTDISNWNGKVSDTGKWNNVSLDKTVTTSTSDQFIPCLNSTSATSAKLIKALSSSYSAYSLAQRDGNGYIIAQTPSANDNSTKVATTAYVDGAVGGITVPTKTSDLTNDSGFITSYTDEKVKSEIVTDSSLYIVGTTSSSTATGTLGKHNSFRAFISGNTDTDGVTRLYLGNGTAAGTAGAKLGAIQIFSNSAYYVELKAGQSTRPGMTANRTVRLPDADGTIALTSDIPQVYSSNNTGGYLTIATLPIYDGTVE